MENILRTEGLTKTYGGKIVVDNINMNIDRGEIYGLIGKNGAGKTTFMRLVLGMAIPNSGSISLFGGQPREQAGKRIGSLIEAPALYARCTAKENLIRYSMIYGAEDVNLDESLEIVGLGDVGNKKVGNFSLGMKQRLGVAIAMLGNPEFMVLDEPINGLDPAGIKQIRDTIHNLNQEKGVTFIIASHLLDELAKVATRFGIINNGVLVDEVTQEELVRRQRQDVRISVNDPARAKAVIEKCFPVPDLRIEVQDDNIIVKSEHLASAAINRVLVDNKIMVSSLSSDMGSMEDYFIERMGA